jgi:hypothetical protein
MREAQEALVKRHLLSDVARTLCNVLEDYNLITQQADRFMILLTEMPPENIAALVEELRRVVAQQTGIELKFGAAHFPQDAVTFESLMEKANREVTNQLKQNDALTSPADTPIPTEPIALDPHIATSKAVEPSPIGSEVHLG